MHPVGCFEITQNGNVQVLNITSSGIFPMFVLRVRIFIPPTETELCPLINITRINIFFVKYTCVYRLGTNSASTPRFVYLHPPPIWLFDFHFYFSHPRDEILVFLTCLEYFSLISHRDWNSNKPCVRFPRHEYKLNCMQAYYSVVQVTIGINFQRQIS